MIDKPKNSPITSTADTSTAPIYTAVAANAKLTQDAIKAAMTPDLVSVDVKANYNTTTVQSQVGLQFGSTQSTTSVTLGDRVVDTSLIHKIRSRSIHFSAYHLKPLTRLYAFFDNINVDHYISSCYRVTVSSPLPAILKTTYFSGTTGGWTTPPVISSSIIAKQSIKEILFHKGSTFFIAQYDNPLVVGENISLDGISYKILTIQPPSANLMTDENGYIAGTFMIPNDANLSFNTGSRAFLLCDSPNNTASQIKTSAEFIYYASGILQTKEAQTLVTRINQVTIDPVLKSKSTAVAGTSIAPTSVSASSPLVLIIDKAGPLVTGRSPIIGATGVDSKTTIEITFNETIIPGSGDITIQRPNGSIVESFSMPNTNVSIIGKVLTITPTVELASLDTYIVNLPTGSVKDALGNDYIKETTVYSFTIKSVPIIYPTITTYSPTKGATGVEVTAPIILTFNKEIVIGSGSITLKQANGTISTTVISAKGNQLTIIPTTNLISLTSYIVMLSAGCVMDLDDNLYTGSSDYTFTCKNIDTTVPTVPIQLAITSTYPVYDAYGAPVSNDFNLIVVFNQPIKLHPDPNYTTSYLPSDPNSNYILIPVTSSSMQITNNTLTIPIKGLLNGVSYKFDLGLKHITALTYIDDNLSYILGDALSLYFTASGTKPNRGPTYSPEFNSEAKISTHRNWIGITFKEKMKQNFPSLQVGTITGTGPGSAYSSTLFSTDSDGTYFKLSPPLGDFLQGYVYSVTINANTFSYAETPSVYWGGTSNWTFTLVGDSYVPLVPNPSIGDICHNTKITGLKGSTEYYVTIPFASVDQEAFIRININTNAAGSGGKYIFVSPSGESPTSVPSYISYMGTDAYTIMGKSSTAKRIYRVKTGADSSTLDVKICSNVEVNITPTCVEVGAAPNPDTSPKYAKFTASQDVTSYTLPGIKGITGWEHWRDADKTSICDLSAKGGLGAADEYRTIPTTPPTQVANGDGFLYAPAGSTSMTWTIKNIGNADGKIESIKYIFSDDLIVSPLIKKFGAGPFTVASYFNDKVPTFPYTVKPGETLLYKTTISWSEIKHIIPWNTGNTWDSAWGLPIVGIIRSESTGIGQTFIDKYKTNVSAAIAAFDTHIVQANVSAITSGEAKSPSAYDATLQFVPTGSVVIHADPLAQTFYVNASENPDGYFVSSVDLFFAKKSNIDDITVQLRPTVNGIPSSDIIIPFATTSLAANDVKTSTYPNASDPNSYTKFRFDSPIFLLPGMYAIVIISPSKEYEIFTATMGGFRINNSDMRISDIPYCGDLFKSSNGSTWLPSPSQDMCFVLNRCNFTSSGSAQFISEKPYVNYTNTFNTFIANTYYSRGDYIRVESGFNMDHIYEAMNTGLTGPTAPDHINGDVMNGLAETGVLLRFLSTSTRNVDINVPYDTYFSQGENINFKNAEAKYFYKGTNTNGTLDADFTPAMLSTNYDLDTRKILDSASSNLRSKIELTTKDSKLSPIIDIARFTNVLVENIINNDVIADDFISHSEVFGGDYIKVPVKGMYNMYKALNTGTTSVEPPYFTYDDIYNGSVLFRYLGSTHNGDTELLPSKGRSLSKYITRKVILADGFESTDITVTFNAFTPYGSSVKVYYKAAFISGGSTLEETPYYEMVLSTRDKNYASQFVEHKYICDYGDGNIRFALPNMNKFNQFIVKIVMLSANSIAVPKIRDLRVIALDD